MWAACRHTQVATVSDRQSRAAVASANQSPCSTNAGICSEVRRNVTHSGAKSAISPCSAAERQRAVELLLDRRPGLVEGPLPLLSRVAEGIPVGAAQRGRRVVPGPAAVGEAQRPSPREVPVDRGLGVDGDVLIQGRPAAGRGKPLKLPLGRFAETGPTRRRTRGAAASAAVVKRSVKILDGSTPRAVSAAVAASSNPGGPHMYTS